LDLRDDLAVETYRNPRFVWIGAHYLQARKAARFKGTVRLFGDSPDGVESVDHDVINYTSLPVAHIENVHTGAGFDRGLDQFALLVHNVTRPVENILVWITRMSPRTTRVLRGW
jgi:hypothetical protein